MIVNPSFSEVSFYTAVPSFFFYPLFDPGSRIFRSLRSTDCRNPCYKRVGRVRAPTVRSDGTLHQSFPLTSVVFVSTMTLNWPLIAELLCGEAHSTVQLGWILRTLFAYSYSICAVFTPCIQDRRQIPQVRNTNAVKGTRLLYSTLHIQVQAR